MCPGETRQPRVRGVYRWYVGRQVSDLTIARCVQVRRPQVRAVYWWYVGRQVSDLTIARCVQVRETASGEGSI